MLRTFAYLALLMVSLAKADISTMRGTSAYSLCCNALELYAPDLTLPYFISTGVIAFVRKHDLCLFRHSRLRGKDPAARIHCGRL